MQSESTSDAGRRVALLGLLAFLILIPVTLPVPVLRGLVQERFGVSELLTSLFMSVNMVGAVIAAPLAVDPERIVIHYSLLRSAGYDRSAREGNADATP